MRTGENGGLSAAVLKNTAIVLMFINHFCVGWYTYVSPNGLFSNFHWYLTRGAFVLFAFLIAEGMIYTRSREKYMLRLFILGLISELPFDGLIYFKVPAWDMQNVFFTLFLGALAIYAAEKIKSRPLAILAAAAILASARLARLDYGFMGIGLIMIFYFVRDKKPEMFIAAFLWIFTGWFLYNASICMSFAGWRTFLDSAALEAHGALAFPLIAEYNGERGRQLPKGFYYFFYPVHLSLIVMIVWLVRY